MTKKIPTWGIPILLVALLASFVVISRLQPAPRTPVANLQDILSNGGYWFIPAILIGLWLAILLDAVRGVGLGIFLGLFSMGVCRLGFPVLLDQFVLHWLNPTVPMTLGGMIGGLIGGLLDRPRKTSRTWEDSLSVKLALLGVGLGFAFGYCGFYLFATLPG